MPSGIERIGFELSVNDVIQSDPLPGDPGTWVRRSHQEHGAHHHQDDEDDHWRKPGVNPMVDLSQH